MVAQVYYGALLHQIGTLADTNGLVRDNRFNGLAISDVETSIRQLEPLLDPTSMEAALRDGYCDAVDFITPTYDAAFYQGIDARPGHLAAGLIAERPEARRDVLSALEAHGAALIVGPSGAGKSALMWDTAGAIRHTTRWFQIRRGDSTDTHLLLRLTHALRASSAAPVGFVLDDVGRGLSGIWGGLIREAGVGTGVVLLGSVREEDLFLLPASSRVREVRPKGDDAVAERIWHQLQEQGHTTWAGWREPWFRSDGLLLEYTHILTRGDRLERVLGEQVDSRLLEMRDTELAILRVTSLAGTAGATIDGERLHSLLDVTQGDFVRALRRLVDEHLIGEPNTGQLAGMHQLRSAVLFDLSHAFPPFTRSRTIAESIHAATTKSLEALAAHVVVHFPGETITLVKALAARLENDRDIEVAIAAFSGLGKAYIETTLRHWVTGALQIGLEPTQVTTAVTFAIAGTDLSPLKLPERLVRAIESLRTRSKSDPRSHLLSLLSSDAISAVVISADATGLRALVGALVEMKLSEDLRSAISLAKPDFDTIDLVGAADLVGAVRLIDSQTATAWTDGGVRESLLARVPLEIPWAGPVEIEAASEGRLLRGAIYHVAHSAQIEVHEEVVNLSKRLLGIDPTAAIVAVDAIAADGLPSGTLKFPVATKRIPRENLPASALPEWNRQWIATAARLVGAVSYTEYLQRAHAMLEKLVPVVERTMDGLLRGKVPSGNLLTRLGEVHITSRALTPPAHASPAGSAPKEHVTAIQNLLFACSAELVRRFTELPAGHGAFVMWTGDLLNQIRKAREEPWELIGDVPEKLLQRTESLVTALRLFAAEAGARNAKPTSLWASITRHADRGNAIRLVKLSVERRVRANAADYLRRVNADLVSAGIELELRARPNWNDPLPWPTLELLAIVSLNSPEDWPFWIIEKAPHVRAAVGEGRLIRFVPRVSGFALSRLTSSGVSSIFSSPYVVDDWLDSLAVPRLDDALTRAAASVIDLVIELDGLRCFGLASKERPAVERAVKEDNERQLEDALVAFEALAQGTSVRSLPRYISEEVALMHIAAAKGAAALTHEYLTPGGEALMNLQFELLLGDLALNTCTGKSSQTS
ncbi:MAG: hypothetical protein NTW01_04710 [Gammaproteobacteria bacterium]|nr:hypothetical protein [Gammaproteobacteria bacterium]